MSGFQQPNSGERPVSRPEEPTVPRSPERPSFGFPGRPTDSATREYGTDRDKRKEDVAEDSPAESAAGADAGTPAVVHGNLPTVDTGSTDPTSTDPTSTDPVQLRPEVAVDETAERDTGRSQGEKAGALRESGVGRDVGGNEDIRIWDSGATDEPPIVSPSTPPPARPTMPAPAPMASPLVETSPTPEPVSTPSPAVQPEPSRIAGRGTPRIIAIANQKGGVGKTTTTVNLGAAAAELGHRVLVVDLDPQGNASTGLGINPRSLEASMYDVLLHDVPIDEAIEAAEVRNLFVAPANLDLAGAEIELVPAFSRELRLKNALAAVEEDFDLILIDCPPSLGLLTVNAFSAASEVLVPIQCEYYALEGLGQLLRNVDLVKRNLNAALELSAIVLVMYDARTNLANQVAGEVREHFGSKVCRSIIPRNIRLSEAPSFGQPITVFDPSSRGAIAYRDLAKEVAGESA